MSDNTLFAIFLLFILFGGGFASGIYKLMQRWQELVHQRRSEAESRAHELEILREKRLLAQASGDAIKILMVNDELGADFDRRLNKAIVQAKARLPEKAGPDETEDATEPARRHSRRS